jgi:hypothetical protein
VSVTAKRLALALAAVALSALATYITVRAIRYSGPLQLLGIFVEMAAAVALVLTLINPWKDRG